MRQHFTRTMGIIAILALLLATSVEPVQAHQGKPTPGKTARGITDDAEPTEDATLICLALVGGIAVLAGIVWLRRLRGMLS